MKKMIVRAGVPAVLLGAGSANAAIDLTAVSTQFTDLGTAQVTVGGAILLAAVVALTYKWLKGMLFG